MSFRELQRYESGKARFDKYKLWLAMSPDQRHTAYAGVTDATKRSKPERARGYISPFGTVGTTKIYVPVEILAKAQTGQGSAVATAVINALGARALTVTEHTALTSPITIDAKKFKSAKLAFTSVIPGSTTQKKNSRITGAAYAKPDVDSVTEKFGQLAGGEDYNAAIALIEATTAFADFVAGNGGKNRFKFTPEG